LAISPGSYPERSAGLAQLGTIPAVLRGTQQFVPLPRY
jgi:hypothetical protein